MVNERAMSMQKRQTLNEILVTTNFATWTRLGFPSNRLGAIEFTDVQAHLAPQKFYPARVP
jgi:hypothetical protein